MSERIDRISRHSSGIAIIFKNCARTRMSQQDYHTKWDDPRKTNPNPAFANTRVRVVTIVTDWLNDFLIKTDSTLKSQTDGELGGGALALAAGRPAHNIQGLEDHFYSFRAAPAHSSPMTLSCAGECLPSLAW